METFEAMVDLSPEQKREAEQLFSRALQSSKGNDYSSAAELYGKAAAYGHPGAQNNLGNLYKSGLLTLRVILDFDKNTPKPQIYPAFSKNLRRFFGFSIYSLTLPYHLKIIQKTGAPKLRIPPAPIVRELFLSA